VSAYTTQITWLVSDFSRSALMIGHVEILIVKGNVATCGKRIIISMILRERPEYRILDNP